MSRAQTLITENIATWTGAIQAKSASGRGSSNKYELYGIKKLRELILELAVRGKLVPQDPNDEPASVLLERIAAEKAELIKQGKIKKPKALSPISDEEKPTDIPSSWRVMRLGDAMNVLNGRAYKKNEMLSQGTPLLRVGNLFTSNEWYYSDLDLEPEKYIDNGDLIYAWSASFGPFIWDGGKVIYHYHIWKLDIFDDNSLNKEYTYLYLKAITESIKASGNGIAMVHMTKERMEKLVLPIPPLAEQQRIVQKVDELMALCDQLEQQTESSIQAHGTLVDTLLATLTNSADADELQQNWARIAEHFDTLFTTEQSIDALKQIILQLAVMGKLVRQNPDDEPASVLLERIAAEKDRLVKEKKIKKQKPLPEISEDEKPFELPDGWEWCRLDDICYGITSGSTPPKQFFQEQPGIPYLKVYNIRNQQIDFDYQPQFVDREYHKSKLKRSSLLPGDVVMNIVGPPLGKVAIIPSQFAEWNCNQAIVFFRPIEKSWNKFIYTYLTSGIFLNNIELIGTAGQDNISVTKSRSIVLPSPPIEEQHRIVAKVDELMTLCDQFKDKLRQSQQTQVQLTDAIIEQTLGQGGGV